MAQSLDQGSIHGVSTHGGGVGERQRPALVLSPASYNRASGLMLCCPMTSQKKGYPFEAIISDDPHRTSVVPADQVKSLDWKTRQTVKKGVASPNAVMETLSKLQTLL